MDAFLTSALDGGEWLASRHNSFTLGVRTHVTHWIGGWVGSRTGLDDVARTKIPSIPMPDIESWSSSP